MVHVLRIRRIAVLALATGLALGVAGAPIATAAPTLAQEEQQGEGIAESLRSGERQCSELSADDFELIGEYAMGNYLGDEGAHAAMNRRMTLMMGEAGERRMHVALGYRYSGCPGGPASGWVGAMGGMMGGRGPGGYGPGMMGGGGAEYGPGSGMMGGYRSGPGAGDNDFDGPSAAAMIGMMAVLIGAVAVVLLWFARRRSSGPLETLKRRYASGELSDEQYQESRRLLEGGR